MSVNQQNKNELIFKSGDLYATEYRGKALKSPTSGVEICLVMQHGTRLILEANRYMHGGRPFSEKRCPQGEH